ncbi:MULTISPECIES: hypothetical protein [Vibrio]|uniref:RiboL-PSP-HEPN domain-containing protein n=1 Tax=Vibrio vulnificus TaxID=672 RepID=A0ABX4WVH5_VIBVL|nr:hypothetical protein [Vibrio vulnificus]MDF5331497.1 hypothetical protein [Vibrio parahaemolyticus]EGQ9939823.1 hypothetical protein [Vibrio vulnificus]EGR0054860.1 hypothetical protein [Vibrio vulnificus]EID4343277.1 hypothetical protein [Vibrio vulnificus]EID4378024.1 hypothetical protein [Vibrio vulnificus]
MKNFYTGETQQLVYAFFLQFSRLEFALKESGYVKAGLRDSAEPDWKRFIEQYSDSYALDKLEKELMSKPPLRQVYRNEQISWVDFEFPEESTELNNLVFALKTMRNNLFHGGKFGHKSWDDPERVEFVLSKGLHTIEKLSKLDGDLTAHYRGSY